MVSTRSGRVVSTEATSFGRITRSRAKKDAETLQEETAAELGQPEVTSPAPALANYFTSKQPSPAPFGGFGSPLGPGHLSGTPVQQDMTGTPFLERVVKTIGKSAARTPAAQTPSGAAAAATPTMTLKTVATPSAAEVDRMARVPLPTDAGSEETEPFASSEDELVGPASPAMAQAPPVVSCQAVKQFARKGVNLLAWFAVGSLLVTAAIALLLSPCLDRELYVAMDSRNYERVCKGLSYIRSDATNRSDRLRALVSARVSALQQGLPPPAADALDQAWAIVKEAHLAAGSAVSPLVAKAMETVAPMWDRAQPSLQRAFRAMAARAAPVLDSLLERVMSADARPSAAAPAPITCSAFNDLLALLDQSSVRPEYLRELWDKAARDVATKQKAAVWLLTCGHAAECAAAQIGMLAAANSYIELDGAAYGDANAAGQLQRELVRFLRAYPDGLVLVVRPERLHLNSLAVLINAVSEGGHLQAEGRAVVTKRALFVLLVEYEGAAGADGPGSDREVAVKKWLTQSISARGSGAEGDSAVVLSFRRRVDAVLPVRKVPAAPSVTGAAPGSEGHPSVAEPTSAAVDSAPPN